MEVLVETIDDLLDAAPKALGTAGLLASSADLLPAPQPCLVLLADMDGAVAFAEDFGSGLGAEATARVARDMASGLARAETCDAEWAAPMGPRRAVALRLTQGWPNGTRSGCEKMGTGSESRPLFPRGIACGEVPVPIFSQPRSVPDTFAACLVDDAAGTGRRDAGPAAIVGAALARAALRYKAQEAELLARTQQLTAGQEALQASYSRSMAETIEEHEHRLRERERLVQAQKLESIGHLAAGIAHEINTPTQFIGDNLRFLEDAFADLAPLLAGIGALQADGGHGEGPLADVVAAARQADLEYLVEEIPRAIAQSLEGVTRVAKIVRSMKEFSHPGSDQMVPVDLNKALECTLTVCRNEWKYVADVATDFDPKLPPVHCLPGDCNQVFLNLIINAAHAIADKDRGDPAEKGTITVRTRADGDWVEVRVGDTGTGIREEHRGKVFDPFFTTKAVGRGTGQGLAIARSVLVDKHGGTLEFETELGRGTTFIVRLPQRAAAAALRKAPHE
jgi:signal transduction histidine kinase